jgi:hypothetical protein
MKSDEQQNAESQNDAEIRDLEPGAGQAADVQGGAVRLITDNAVKQTTRKVNKTTQKLPHVL